MTQDEIIDDIMRRANLLAMKKVRRFACNQHGYRGPETDAIMTAQVDKFTAELRTAVEAAVEVEVEEWRELERD